MSTVQRPVVRIEALVQAPRNTVWHCLTRPEEIVQWNTALDTWHSPHAAADLKPGGAFLYRMEAKDGSAGFDFAGVFESVRPVEYLSYILGDGRRVEIVLEETAGGTHVREQFEAESENPIELQRDGWQAILNNFKRHTESRSGRVAT